MYYICMAIFLNITAFGQGFNKVLTMILCTQTQCIPLTIRSVNIHSAIRLKLH